MQKKHMQRDYKTYTERESSKDKQEIQREITRDKNIQEYTDRQTYIDYKTHTERERSNE